MGGSSRTYCKHKNTYIIFITTPNKNRIPETIGVDGKIIKIDYIHVREQDVDWDSGG
jgi:hypothetical protein